jgi:hypothetical protein
VGIPCLIVRRMRARIRVRVRIKVNEAPGGNPARWIVAEEAEARPTEPRAEARATWAQTEAEEEEETVSETGKSPIRAPEVGAHSAAVDRAAVQRVPAASGGLPAWGDPEVGVEAAVEAAAGGGGEQTHEQQGESHERRIKQRHHTHYS